MDELLAGLNEAQRAAVTSDAAVLQVLAPPGSGKTKTLTARVAHLITLGLKPWNIIVCTFTVKAAKEMQERIKGIVGEEVKSKLKIGTFHGIALQYLRHYRREAGLKDNFGVADSSDSIGIVRRLIKTYDPNGDVKRTWSRISSLKSKGIDHNKFAAQCRAKKEQQEFALIYQEYQAALELCNLLDYDDILLRCASLLQEHPECVSHVEAVLVDEFQDTNGVQYNLMRLFAQRRSFITIVGDPDQSIYGWRSAEIKNLGRMKEDWPGTRTINLKENYRSSGGILHAAQEIIEQDQHRPPKKLQATHSFGHKPVLRRLPTAWCEASWIVTEIRRLRALSGQLLGFNDFALLLRSAHLSRIVESAFAKEGIPYRMVGGTKFYDRKEVQIILDYLRVINAPSQNEALERVLNLPNRHVGDATVEKLRAEARTRNMTLWEVICAARGGQRGVNIALSTQTATGLGQFMDIVIRGQRKLKEDVSIADLMQFVINKINLAKYLKDKHSEDHENRWANVEELLAQAIDASTTTKAPSQSDEEKAADITESDESPLCRFLANVSLASSADDKSKEEVEQGGVVTISTIHAAKGLEWPIVFVPACFIGSIPHSRAEDHDEERRLLYVGMTRAQAMLYLSCPLQDSQRKDVTLSTFLSQSGVKKFFDERGPSIRLPDAKNLAKVLGRAEPCGEDIAKTSATLESEEDNWWPTTGERPLGYTEEAEAQAKSLDCMPVFGNTRSASWVTGGGQDEGGSTFLPGFSSVKTQFGDLVKKQEQLDQQRISEKLEAAMKYAQPKGRKRQIDGQSTLTPFFGKKSRTDNQSFPRQSVSDTAVLRDITNINTEDDLPTTRAVDLSRIHRSVRAEPLLRRPQTKVAALPDSVDQSYVFLSSSPTKSDGETNRTEIKAPPAPAFKPAATLHTTSMGTVVSVRKTLGAKRSVNGWSWSGRKQ